MHFPGFLHNLTMWLTTHVEGVAKGTADEAKIEASPVVEQALAIGETAARDYLTQHVAHVTGTAPTPEGLAGLVSDVIDGRASLPVSAKEPLKLLLGGLAAAIQFPPVAPASEKDSLQKDSLQGAEKVVTLGPAGEGGTGGVGDGFAPLGTGGQF